MVSLYPNLDTGKIVENLGEIIGRANIKWSNVDLLEGARYLALNWSEEQIRRSSLRRIIPWRRNNRGTRPGMRGGRTQGERQGGPGAMGVPPSNTRGLGEGAAHRRSN